MTEARYRITLDTTVGEVLFVLPNAAAIFEAHGCEPTWECTEEHHAEYTLGDTSLYCHIDDPEALVEDLNRALDAEEARVAAEAA